MDIPVWLVELARRPELVGEIYPKQATAALLSTGHRGASPRCPVLIVEGVAYRPAEVRITWASYVLYFRGDRRARPEERRVMELFRHLSGLEQVTLTERCREAIAVGLRLQSIRWPAPGRERLS